MDRSFGITYFNRLYDTQGSYHELNLDDLTSLVLKNFEVEYKDKAPGIVFGKLENNSRAFGTEVLSRSCLSIDYDHIDNLSEWGEALYTLLKDFYYILYTSFSHTKENARVRVIIPLAKDVCSEQYEDFINNVYCYSSNKILGKAIDKTTYQAKRFMFCHSCPIGNTEGFSYVNKGQLLDISWYPYGKKQETDTQYKDTQAEFKDYSEAITYFNNNYPGDKIYSAIKDEEYIEIFNKIDIEWFIETKLNKVYVDKYKNRYRYVNSHSGINGAIVYNNVLFSNHETDPAGDGHTHGCFDLLQKHFCGDKYISAINYVKRLLNYRFYQ